MSDYDSEPELSVDQQLKSIVTAPSLTSTLRVKCPSQGGQGKRNSVKTGVNRIDADRPSTKSHNH